MPSLQEALKVIGRESYTSDPAIEALIESGKKGVSAASRRHMEIAFGNRPDDGLQSTGCPVLDPNRPPVKPPTLDAKAALKQPRPDAA